MANLFDLFLAPALICVAFASLAVRDLFTGIVFYILFGLLMSLAWVELKAPDIALVEAAVGAGLIGALFLGVLGRMECNSQVARQGILLLLLASTAALICSACVLGLPAEAYGLWKEAVIAQPLSGSSNLTTAVIINYRGYDTLLEMGVLFIVALGVYALKDFLPAGPDVHLSPPEPLFILLLRLLTPLMILFGAYLLWIGSHLPGGAFQAGALFAGAGILLRLGSVKLNLDLSHTRTKWALSVGILGFIIAGVITIFLGDRFLQYPSSNAGTFVFAVEFFATISIATTLLSLFFGCAGFLKKM